MVGWLGGWVVGILESNAKLNSKLRLKLKLMLELSLAKFETKTKLRCLNFDREILKTSGALNFL